MSSTTSNAVEILREAREQLLAPIPDLETVLKLLCLPLDLLGLLDASLSLYGGRNAADHETKVLILSRWIPSLQGTVLDRVVVDWQDALRDADLIDHTLYELFCPTRTDSPEARLVALSAYDVLLAISTPLGEETISNHRSRIPTAKLSFILEVLVRLVVRFPIDVLHQGIFESTVTENKKLLLWNDCVRNLAALPTKVANLSGHEMRSLPDSLLLGNYFEALAQRYEVLLYRTSGFSRSERELVTVLDSLSVLLVKMIRIGLFPAERKASHSFFSGVFPIIQRHLLVQPGSQYSAKAASYSFLWQRLLFALPSTDTAQVLRSLFAVLDPPVALSTSELSKQTVKRAAVFLDRLIGSLSGQREQNDEKWSIVLDVAVPSSRTEWSIGFARVFICWISGLTTAAEVSIPAMERLLDRLLELWADPSYIKFSLVSRHQYTSALLLLTIAHMPPMCPALLSLSINPVFLSGVSAYLDHLDPSIRRLGLLVAEVLSAATANGSKPLDFGPELWEGEGEGKELARDLRHLIESRDGDYDLVLNEEILPPTEEEKPSPKPIQIQISPKKPEARKVQLEESYDSDDSLTGYPSPPISRSPSPTASQLDEIEKDPTLNNPNKKKIAKPVYLADLGSLLRDSQNVEKVEVGLEVAEDLIRRKMNYGTELEENAVNLTHAAVGLQDDFSLDQFETRQQALLVALVACCPKLAAPCIIEQFFHHQYSVAQRSAMLTSLALGARELAGLGSEASQTPLFPSKKLPAAQHQRYITAQEETQLENISRGISNLIIDKQSAGAEDKVPAIAREKQLLIRKTTPRRVTELGRHVEAPPVPTAFKDIAAEYFLMPFINRFWLYLRDEQTREERTAISSSRYRGAGTGMILSPLMLVKILATLAVLMHCARHSAAYLTILSPETVELAATVGTRSMSITREEGEASKEQASVLSAALELALVVLDSCLELDGGRTLAYDHARLVAGVGDWATEIFRREDSGMKYAGAGAMEEGRLRRAAAAVVLRVEDLLNKWRGVMISEV